MIIIPNYDEFIKESNEVGKTFVFVKDYVIDGLFFGWSGFVIRKGSLMRLYINDGKVDYVKIPMKDPDNRVRGWSDFAMGEIDVKYETYLYSHNTVNNFLDEFKGYIKPISMNEFEQKLKDRKYWNSL